MNQGQEAKQCESNQRVHVACVVRVVRLDIQWTGLAYILLKNDMMRCKRPIVGVQMMRGANVLCMPTYTAMPTMVIVAGIVHQ